MSNNPYRAEGASDLRLPKDSRAKTRIIWFLFGFVAASGIWSIWGYARARPQDYTQSWPSGLREVAGEHWLKRARGVDLGTFVVYVAAESSQAAALIHPKPLQYPQVYYVDEDANGYIDSLMAYDSSQRSINLSDEDADGSFNSFIYSTDTNSFVDVDLDGQYDHRYGPGRQHAVFIDSQWHDVMAEGQKLYVMLNGKRTELRIDNGIWKVSE